MKEVTVPEWVPPEVIQVANMLAGSLAAAPSEVLDLLSRLVTDGRIKGVWQDLQKHKREDYTRTSSQFYETEIPEAIRSGTGMAMAWRTRAAECRELGESSSAEELTEEERHGV